MSSALVATLDAQLAKTPWQNLDVLASYLAENPKLLELSAPELADQLGLTVNQAAVILSSPAAYQRIVAATLQRTVRPQDHAEIIRTIAEKAKDPDQPLGQQVAAAKFVAQQTGVLQPTKTAHQEEKVFRVVLTHSPLGKGGGGSSELFDTSTRLVDPTKKEAPESALPRGGEDVVDADFAPAGE